MDAEPIPASFEKAARLNPCTRTPTAPHATPSGLNAHVNICENASPIILRFEKITNNDAVT